ncbi:MAG: aspartate--ammonia ligase [bacterium]|nr:aspartate--ammonia ligase [bacterium]
MSAHQQIAAHQYKPALDLHQTQIAIKVIKDHFQIRLAESLNLQRVTAPLFVASDSGLNDRLNGIERPISFDAPALGERTLEIVQSLAKWKRYTLAQIGLAYGEGIYADMNALRRDEELDELHSIYVDQWDWERVIRPQDRHLGFLCEAVTKIYRSLTQTEELVVSRFPTLRPFLPQAVKFLQAQELEDRYPTLTPAEREDRVAEEYGAVFVIGIGAKLEGGAPHDGRAPDYDDWSTPTEDGIGLNGDLIVWNPVMRRAFEVSSMGVRVDRKAMLEQLAIRGCPQWAELPFHRRLLEGQLPQSIGGGIGQSRLCMLLLQKAHIGEVQASLWPIAMLEEWMRQGISLLSH